MRKIRDGQGVRVRRDSRRRDRVETLRRKEVRLLKAQSLG
jgi:hypothetical protein